MAAWTSQLRQILESPVHLRKIPLPEWREMAHSNSREETWKPGFSVRAENGLFFFIRGDERMVELLEVEGEQDLNEREMALTGLLIQQIRQSREPESRAVSESEQQARELGQWVAQQLEASENETMPDRLTMGGRLFVEMVPFLIVSEHGDHAAGYAELEKLLRSFLAEDVILLPLKKQEWLVLGPITLVRDSQGEERFGDEEESEEESLASICLGLHEMLASEWLGDCHLAVAPPVIPAKSIVETAALLRETTYLGRKFHVGTNIHLPWLLHLERLLNSIPEPQRSRYVEQAFNRTDLFVEPEILATLETFFALDCNVSETAKKLYIHRNTLLYRLDKLKQESGLDVRTFRDAVLVKIILLLYKVTKRA